MSLNVVIPPEWAATAVAQSSEARDQSTNNALVLDLFCDGSFKHRPPRAGIGIVTNMWLPHTTKKQRTSKACFIPCGFRYKDDDNNTTEAFALAEGAHVALDQITNIKKGPSIRSMDKIEVTFWSDSKLVLTALGSSARARLLSKKMQHILDIIKLKTQELHESVETVSVQFRWCPEECVEPHALADQLSKGARMSGRSMYSKALTFVHGVSHSKIQSALGQSRATATDTAPAQSSSLGAGGAGSSFVDRAAKFQNSALRPITRDPVIMNVLYRAAGSSRFFSIVGGMVECLPSNLRPIMHEAIREQQDANKKFQRHACELCLQGRGEWSAQRGGAEDCPVASSEAACLVGAMQQPII